MLGVFGPWFVNGTRAQDPTLTPEPLVVGHSVTFRSEVLDQDRTILVALPGDYESRPLAAFPVVYVLDGRSQFLHTTATIDVLSRSGRVPAMIVIGIANVDRRRDFTAIEAREGEPYGGASVFLDFLDTELVPLVERSFRTLPHRTLIGHSLGGLFALHALVTKPDLFRAVIAISPALSSDEVEVDGQPAPFTDRAETLFRTRDSLPRFVYMTMSAGETRAWIDDLDRFRRVLKRNAPADLEWHLVDMPDDTHGTTVLRSTDDGLRELYRGWDGSAVFAAGDADTLEPHFRQLSTRLGYDVPVPEEAINRFGYALLEAGRIDDAITALRFNADHNPDSPNVHDSLGEALLSDGRIDEAVVRFERAVRLGESTGHPALEVYRQHLATARAALTVDGD
jgi:pimeloyl-ACP methyl ester carboxylesterase